MRGIPDPILTNWYYFFLHFYINVFANCHLRGSISGNLTQIQETCQNKSMTDFFHEADYVIHFYLALKRYSHSASSANLTQMFSHSISVAAWCNDITTAQIGPTKPEIRFCADSDPGRDVSEICCHDKHWQHPIRNWGLKPFVGQLLYENDSSRKSLAPHPWPSIFPGTIPW